MRFAARTDPRVDGRRGAASAVLTVGVVCAIAWTSTSCTTVPAGDDRAGVDVGSVTPTQPTPEEPATPASDDADAPELVDASFVDVETGRARELPRSIRAVAGADHFQVSPAGTRIAFSASDGIHVAQLDGRHMRRLATVRGATAPSWSPDGRTLVASDGARLFIVTVRTGRVTALGRPGRQVWHPNFSPDGRAILFTRRTRGDLELWTIPVTGGPGSVVLELPTRGAGAAFGSFGPDGRIAFRRTNFDGTAITEMTEAGVWIAQGDGSDRVRVKRGASMSQIDPQALWPAWSPDGTRIAFEWLYQQGIRVLDLATGSVARLGRGIHPSWVDDHTLIIEDYRYAAPTGGDPSDEEASPSALVHASFVDLDSGRARSLPWTIRSVAGAEHFQVAPGGGRLAFDGDDGIYVASVDGASVRRVARTPGGVAPAWSPDGRELAYGDGTRLFVVRVGTGLVRRVGPPGEQVWRPTFSPDGRTILFTRRIHGDLALWTIARGGGAPGRLLQSISRHDGFAFGTYGPDGWIAFRRTQFDGVFTTEMTSGRVWIARADGTHRRPASGTAEWMSQIDVEGLWPSWSPDGTLIAFEWLYERGIRVVNVRTGRVRRIAEGFHPSWFDDHTLIVERGPRPAA